MAEYVLSLLADKQLADIWDDTEEKRGEAQAQRYTDALDARCAWLAENPFLGRDRREIRNGIRSFQEGEHLVFYRILGDDIEIIAFPHAKKDPENYLSN